MRTLIVFCLLLTEFVYGMVSFLLLLTSEISVPFSLLGIWELATVLWNPKCQLGQWRAKHDLWCRAGRCPLVDNICIFYYVITKDSRLGAKNININHKSWLLLLTKVDYHCYHWKDLVWCISQQLYYVQIMLLVKNWEFLLPICI